MVFTLFPNSTDVFRIGLDCAVPTVWAVGRVLRFWLVKEHCGSAVAADSRNLVLSGGLVALQRSAQAGRLDWSWMKLCPLEELTVHGEDGSCLHVNLNMASWFLYLASFLAHSSNTYRIFQKPPVCGGRGELVGDLETVWRAKLLDCHYLTPIPSTTHPGDEWRDDSLVQSSNVNTTRVR
ncbi:hypothetical protein J6590_072251 [Homalodisca vitripennis]|nr:hypothetical protein J6590_072251 [Homalodisca vitripennis]